VGAVGQVARRAARLVQPAVGRVLVGLAVAVVIDAVAQLGRGAGRALAHLGAVDARQRARAAGAHAVGHHAARAVEPAHAAHVGRALVGGAVAVVVEAVAELRRHGALLLHAGQAVGAGRVGGAGADIGGGADALGVGRVGAVGGAALPHSRHVVGG